MSDVAYFEGNRDKTQSPTIFSSTATSVSSSAAFEIPRTAAPARSARGSQQDIESAVYGYIQALRVLAVAYRKFTGRGLALTRGAAWKGARKQQ